MYTWYLLKLKKKSHVYVYLISPETEEKKPCLWIPDISQNWRNNVCLWNMNAPETAIFWEM